MAIWLASELFMFIKDRLQELARSMIGTKKNTSPGSGMTGFVAMPLLAVPARASPHHPHTDWPRDTGWGGFVYYLWDVRANGYRRIGCGVGGEAPSGVLGSVPPGAAPPGRGAEGTPEPDADAARLPLLRSKQSNLSSFRK